MYSNLNEKLEGQSESSAQIGTPWVKWIPIAIFYTISDTNVL